MLVQGMSGTAPHTSTGAAALHFHQQSDSANLCASGNVGVQGYTVSASQFPKCFQHGNIPSEQVKISAGKNASADHWQAWKILIHPFPHLAVAMPLGTQAAQDIHQVCTQLVHPPHQPCLSPAYNVGPSCPTNGSGRSPHNSRGRACDMVCCLTAPCCANLELEHMHLSGREKLEHTHLGGRENTGRAPRTAG